MTVLPSMITLNTWFFFLLQVADYLNAYPNDVLTIFDKVLRRTALKFSEKAFPKQSKYDLKCFPHTRITGEMLIVEKGLLFNHQPIKHSQPDCDKFIYKPFSRNKLLECKH